MTALFFETVSRSLGAAWLVLLILPLRLLLRRCRGVPRWTAVALWGIVALRLLLPGGVESAFSLVPRPLSGGAAVEDWADDYVGEVSFFHDNSPFYEAAVAAGREPIAAGEGGHYVATAPDRVSPPPTVAGSGGPRLAAVWAAGIALLGGWTLSSTLRLRRRLATAVRWEGNVYQSEAVETPFVFGLFRPRIYLPFALEAEVIGPVLAHERAHLRRLDHWWKALGFALAAVHWFNPLIWLGYHLLCRDIELACDERVVRTLDSGERADYSAALLACSVGGRRSVGCPLAFGEVGVSERVRSVLDYRRPAFWGVLAAGAACVAAAVCLLTDPLPPREFPMTGPGPADLEPGEIVERIAAAEGVESGTQLYIDGDAFRLTLTPEFHWKNERWKNEMVIRYFFWKDQQIQGAELRGNPWKEKLYLSESGERLEAERQYLLLHCLEALQHLPVEEIEQLAPGAELYQISQINTGGPEDFDRVVPYSAEGAGPIDGWYIHLAVQPLFGEPDGPLHGLGTDRIHLFYGTAADTPPLTE
ncbi:MAG: M56 family metallopeptidase, partial [Clostridia bacterium]|nr:M56 family metallopeptidase [Clostridia bacterium]